MALPGSKLARKVLDDNGLDYFRLYTQKRAHDRSYKIYGRYNARDLGLLQQELAAAGARNVRPVHFKHYNAGVRFEY